MKKIIVAGIIMVAVLALFSIYEALAWGEKAKAKEAPKEVISEPQPVADTAEKQKIEREKNILIANLNAMNSQQTTVNVLQVLLNREVMELRRMQAVFCDQYSLNPDKWRQGLYEYDALRGCFVEKTK